MKNRNSLFAFGRPLSPLYSLIMRLRELLYRRHVFTVTRFDVPVISVGNLTLGGTGKTPMVQHLARLLRKEGLKPAVISRGYGGATTQKVNVVSEGGPPLLKAEYVGDEPRLLAETLRDVPVLTGVVRRLPAARAIELGANVLILDDGFQHLSVYRDIDLVLFNADSLAGNSRVFPGGDLREPVSALNRCHCFVLTGTCARNRERAERFARLLAARFPGTPIFFASYEPSCFVRRSDERESGATVTAMPNESPCLGFSGIARPEGFRQSLLEFGLEVADFSVFPDHYRYRNRDIADLVLRAQQCGAGALVTTEKDLVKLGGLAISLPLYALRMEVKLDEDFYRFLRERLSLVPGHHPA